jgi:hypothetical protein
MLRQRFQQRGKVVIPAGLFRKERGLVETEIRADADNVLRLGRIRGGDCRPRKALQCGQRQRNAGGFEKLATICGRLVHRDGGLNAPETVTIHLLLLRNYFSDPSVPGHLTGGLVGVQGKEGGKFLQTF